MASFLRTARGRSGGVDAIEAFNAKVEEDHHNRLAWGRARASELPSGVACTPTIPTGWGRHGLTRTSTAGPFFVSPGGSWARPAARRFLPRPDGAAALAAAAVAAR